MIRSVLLLGNPNAGKTTLFNALTGMNARVANYPGITVEAQIGKIERFNEESVDVVDLPGTYSLIPNRDDEKLTIQALLGSIESLKNPSLIVVVVDASELRRGFYLYSQVIELGFRAIIALTMVDENPEFFDKNLIKIMNSIVGTYVVPVHTKDKTSIAKLIHTIDGIIAGSLKSELKEQPILYKSLSHELQQRLSKKTHSHIDFIKEAQQSSTIIKNRHIYLYGLYKRGRLSHEVVDIDYLNLDKDDIAELDNLISLLPEERFRRVDAWISHLKNPDKKPKRVKSDAIDKILLNPWVGSIFAILVFVSLVEALFSIAAPISDFMGEGIMELGSLLAQFLPIDSLLRSLLLDGIFLGLGSILSFLPMIAFLFFFLSILEDSGYLARATFLFDKLLKKTGLCGRSLVPMLSGFACAVPAIMASRTIGSKKERLITILVTPFLTCSARLPVFALIIGALFSSYPPIFGLINVGAFMFLAMYSLGLFAALLSAFVTAKILKTTDAPQLTIELPPYRLPSLRSIIQRVLDRIYLFLRDVGSVILAATILMWTLFRFEVYEVPNKKPNQSLAQVHPDQLENSYAGVIGKSIEPLFKPLGLDWQISMGIMASFVAREVFVSTMAVIYGMAASDENDKKLKNAFKEHVSPLSGLCLLIFFTLSMQCVSTLAVTKRETGSFFWPILQFCLMTGSAYLLALITYFTGFILGFA